MFQPQLLKGQRILVTGGGTGLGRAMTEQFLRLGAELYICGRRQGVCQASADELMRIHGGSVKTYGLDIRDAQAVEAMADAIFAEGALTGLVNNAAGNFISPTAALSPRGFDAIANIVMHGTFYVTHAVGRRWVEMARSGAWTPDQPYRSVISIIVTWVLNGGPFVVPSAMSKSALHAMTMSLATEWARYGIRLNAIGPGEIPTEGMSKRLNPGEEPGARSAKSNPMGRAGTLQELQNLSTFLMSDGCQWLNGQSIMMDGGGYLGTGGQLLRTAPLGRCAMARGASAHRSAESAGSRRPDGLAPPLCRGRGLHPGRDRAPAARHKHQESGLHAQERAQRLISVIALAYTCYVKY